MHLMLMLCSAFLGGMSYGYLNSPHINTCFSMKFVLNFRDADAVSHWKKPGL